MTTPIGTKHERATDTWYPSSKKPRVATEASSSDARTSTIVQKTLETQNSPLISLPDKALARIADHLTLEDFTNLKATCKDMRLKLKFEDPSVYLESLINLILPAIEQKDAEKLSSLILPLWTAHQIRKNENILHLILAITQCTANLEEKSFCILTIACSLAPISAKAFKLFSEKIKNLLEHKQDLPPLMLMRFASKLAQYDPDEALSLYNQILATLKQQKDMPNAFISCSQLREIGHVIENIARDFPEKYPQFLDFMKMILELLNKQDTEKANRLFNKALAYNPKNVFSSLQSWLDLDQKDPEAAKDVDKYNSIKAALFLQGNNLAIIEKCVEVAESMGGNADYDPSEVYKSDGERDMDKTNLLDLQYKYRAFYKVISRLISIDLERSLKLLNKIPAQFHELRYQKFDKLVEQSINALKPNPENFGPFLEYIESFHRQMNIRNDKEKLGKRIQDIRQLQKD